MKIRRREKMLADGSLIMADLSKQAPNNSYSPPTEYRDTEFTCVDCGKEEFWTAQQQLWWYEVAKGSINAVAIRCDACRDIDHLVKKASPWPLSKKPFAIVLETDELLIRQMKKVVETLDPELVLISRLTTHELTRGLWHVLPQARFISFGRKWLSVHEKKLLRNLYRQPCRPVLFHGAATELSLDIAESLRRIGWNVREVDCSKVGAIESDWGVAVSSLLKLKTVGPK